MYCVKCGVELADTEVKCPLCGTVAYHPDIERGKTPPTYPHYVRETENMRPQGVLFILTVLAMMPITITLFCDIHFNNAVTWSGYAVGAILLLYCVAVLPTWFPSPNPVIFVPIDFAVLGLYLLYIDLYTQGGWFLSFAFPVVGAAGLAVTAIVTLMRYLRGARLYIFGGAFIACGGYCVLIECFINYTFTHTSTLVWSPYPLISCLFAGLTLIVIAMSPPLRESLKRKFFI